mmetsp:Transcript_6559/g.16224  ORF Transcript_6559/g.16224 Transcript_6559/m.16224 type:complete len:231 (-) Transcript_6559:1896-2588(-)
MRRGCVQRTEVAPPSPLPSAASSSICGTCVDLPEPVSPHTMATWCASIARRSGSSSAETGSESRYSRAACPSSPCCHRSHATCSRAPSSCARCRCAASRACSRSSSSACASSSASRCSCRTRAKAASSSSESASARSAGLRLGLRSKGCGGRPASSWMKRSRASSAAAASSCCLRTTLSATLRQIFSMCFCRLRTPASRQYQRISSSTASSVSDRCASFMPICLRAAGSR